MALHPQLLKGGHQLDLEDAFAAGRESVLKMLREPSDAMRMLLRSRGVYDPVTVCNALATAIEAAANEDGR